MAETLTGLKNYPVDLERDFAYRLKDLKSDSSKAPGLNEANIKMMARRAYLEGDIKSYEFYLKLLDDVSEKWIRRLVYGSSMRGVGRRCLFCR